VAYSIDDASEGSVAGSSLTFTTDNWAAPQSIVITGEDDNDTDGNQAYKLVFESALGADYAGLVPPAADLTNIDSETAGFTVEPLEGTTSETGSQFLFTVVLNEQPTGNVVVPLNSNDQGEGRVNKTVLTFTTANWNAPQTVTVTGRDDLEKDGDQPYKIVFAATTGADAQYNAIRPPDISLVNTDFGDSEGYLITDLTNNVTEDGTQATFTIRLTSRPAANVRLVPVSSDTGEGTVSPGFILFGPSNWSSPRTVTITGVDDSVDDGDQPFSIVFAPATSSDSNYSGLQPTSVAVVNEDNDTAGIVIGQVSGNTSEDETQATFTVRLQTQPSGPVARVR